MIDEGEVFEVRAHFLGNLDYSVQWDIDTFKAAGAKGMRCVYREEVLLTEIEISLAQVAVVTHGTNRHERALALANALERGKVETRPLTAIAVKGITVTPLCGRQVLKKHRRRR